MEIRCIHRARSALGESALWSPEEKVLYWLDQMRPELHRLDPATGVDSKIEIDLPAQLGGLVRRVGGGLALAASDGISDALYHRRRQRYGVAHRDQRQNLGHGLLTGQRPIKRSSRAKSRVPATDARHAAVRRA